MRTRLRLRALAVVLATAGIGGSCAPTAPESPWAFDAEPPEAPDTASEGGNRTEAGAATPAEDDVHLIDQECYDDSVRCGIATVPQLPGSLDRVSLEYRVVAESGDRTPVVHLLPSEYATDFTPTDLPDRPLIAIGSRGSYPGAPSLYCPELGGTTDLDAAAQLANCADRLARAGVDPAGSVASQLGRDVGGVLAALGYERVDLIVPGWRALSVTAIAEQVDVRTVVYVDPWLGSDRAVAAVGSMQATLDAVWAHCRAADECSTPGTVGDFLAVIDGLDERPLVWDDGGYEEGLPIEASQVLAAIHHGRSLDSTLAFLPELHQALVDRDAATVGAFVHLAYFDTFDVSQLAVTCSLRQYPALPDTLPETLRAAGQTQSDRLTELCAAWPSEDASLIAGTPGLTVFTESTSSSSADYERAAGLGPTITEPTVGAPSRDCVIGAALAWFDEDRVDESSCSIPLSIGSRDEPITYVDDQYTTDDSVIELSVPDSWGATDWGTWWREADPFDRTNLDVWVTELEPAASRVQITNDWAIVDPDWSETTIGDRTWLLATGTDEYDPGTVYQVATASVDDHVLAVILTTETDEAAQLAEHVLQPALATITATSR